MTSPMTGPPSVTFHREPGINPRYCVSRNGDRVRGAFITRVSAGWRLRIGEATADFDTLLEAKELFRTMIDELPR